MLVNPWVVGIAVASGITNGEKWIEVEHDGETHRIACDQMIAAFLAMCLWAAAFPVLALLCAATCALKTAIRRSLGGALFEKLRNSL